MKNALLILISLIFVAGCSKEDEKKTQTTATPTVVVSLEIKNLMSPYYTSSISESFFNEALSKTHIDFGDLSKGVSKTKTIKILNNPLLSQFISNVSIIEVDPKIFSISNNTCQTLNAGSSCSFDLTATVPSSIYSGQKNIRLILGKDDKGQDISADFSSQINGDILESYLTTTQGFSVEMPKSFTQEYSQDAPQERVIKITNNNMSRFLKNSFSSSSFVGVNNSDFVIKSNSCNYPIPPTKSCELTVLYKTWKNNTQIPDIEMKIPNLDQKLSLKTGQLNTYVGTYSGWSACSSAAICSGQGLRTQTLLSCVKNGTDIVDSSNCVAQLQEGCYSPAGGRTISVDNGMMTQYCQANSTSWENQSISCNSGYHNFNFECVPDVYVATYSNYATNEVSEVCSGTQKAFRSILTCSRLHDSQAVATTLCNDVDPFVFYYSPEGSRNVSISNGSRVEKCSQGANNWRTTSVSCNLNYHQSGDNCVADTYLAIEFTPYDNNIVTQACSGTQTAHRTISKCVKSHNYEVVSTSLCVDPNPVAIYQSPYAVETLVFNWGLQFLKCEAGATTWDVSSVSCAQYYNINPSDTRICIANNVSDPIASLEESSGKNNPLEFSIIADNNTNKVDIFSENTCTNKIGSAIKGAGIWDVSLSLNLNSINPIFIESSNTVTLKKSGCVFVKNYKHDNTPPVGSLTIESNAIYSTKKVLTLSTIASDIGTSVKAMKISEDNSCQTGTYVPYATTYQVTPSVKKGEVFYSVKYMDEVNNESPCYTARIIYELIPSMVSTVASNWNEYFLKTDPTQMCDGTELGTDTINPPCVHGGEKRKIVLDQTSCLNLTMIDSLGMFSWKCSVVSGRATFTSSLLPGVRLLSMVDESDIQNVKWKKVMVTLRDQGADIVQSELFTWLSNPIILPTLAANTVTNLNDSGAVYAIKPSSTSGGIQINADKISLINLENSLLTFSNTSANCDYNNNGTIETGEKCIIFSKDKKFIYVESSVTGENLVSHGMVFNGSKYVYVNYSAIIGGSTGLNLNSTSFNKVVRLNSINMKLEPLKLTQTNYSLFYGINSANSSTSSAILTTNSNGNIYSNITLGNILLDGIQLVNSSNNKFSQISVSSAQRKAISSDSSSSSNSFNDMIIAGNTTGIDISGSFNTLVSINIINNSSNGLIMTTPSKQNLISNLMLLNNKGSGIKVDNSLYNALSNMYILNQETLAGNAAIFYNGSSLYNKISGSLLIPSSSSIPCYSTSNANGISNLCAPQTYSGFAFSNSIMNLSGIFKTSSAQTNVYDPLLFAQPYSQNKFLTGFIKSVDFSNNSNAGFCGFTGGLCSALEFSLTYTDQTLLKMLPILVPTPPTVPSPSNEVFIGGSSCPASVNGSEFFDDGICVSNSSPYSVFPAITLKANCLPPNQIWASVQKSSIGTAAPVAAVNYLKNAREITNPYNSFYGEGNHNGICESGESCIYTPNVGAYQGYGELKSCIYNNNSGPVTDVKMYGYEGNGE